MTKATTKQARLADIAERITRDKICDHLAAGATQLVPGEGNPDADIMLVGEAPGASEDKQGRPFVGAAGQFLNEMIESIGLRREDTYITNIVKYRPPENRDPEPEEIKEFLPYLQEQIQVIQPAVVATLGRHATNIFLPNLRISDIHGQPKRIRIQQQASSNNKQPAVMSLVVLPLYHPAAALYNGSMRDTLLDDFARLPAVISKVTSPKQTKKGNNT